MSYLNIPVGTGRLMVTDVDSGTMLDLGEVTHLEIGQDDLSTEIQPETTAKGFISGMECTMESYINRDLFERLTMPSSSSEFSLEWNIPIQATTA